MSCPPEGGPQPCNVAPQSPGPGLPSPRRILGPGEWSVCSGELLLPPPQVSAEERAGQSRDQTALSSVGTHAPEAGTYESLLKGQFRKEKTTGSGRVGKGRQTLNRCFPEFTGKVSSSVGLIRFICHQRSASLQNFSNFPLWYLLPPLRGHHLHPEGNHRSSIPPLPSAHFLNLSHQYEPEVSIGPPRSRFHRWSEGRA